MARPNEFGAGPREAILILGMHRSGTSAMTRVLSLLGAELGKRLLPSAEDNAAGFWENSDVVAAHERLLEAMQLTWHDPVSLPPQWKRLPAVRHFRETIEQLIDEQFGAAPLIALKDPRLSRFAPIWTEVLAAKGITPKIVIMVRHPSEIARSLKMRDDFTASKSHLLWLLHSIESIAAAEGFRHVFVHYERLLANWRTEIMRVSNALNVVWPHSVEEVGNQVDDYLDPGLRHHKIDAMLPGDQSPSIHHGRSGIIARVYEACEEMSTDATSANAVIRSLLKEVKPWLDVFGDPAREVTLRAHHLSDELHAQSVAALSTLQEENSSLRASVTELELERDMARINVDDLANQVQLARKSHEARDKAERELREAIVQRDGEILKRDSGIAALMQEVDAARGNMGELEGQISSARAAHDARDKAERELREAIVQRDGEILKRDSGIAALMQEVDAARSNMGELESQISMARAAHEARDKVEGELRNTNAELHEKALRLEQALSQSMQQFQQQQVEMQRLESALWMRLGRVIGLMGKE